MFFCCIVTVDFWERRRRRKPERAATGSVGDGRRTRSRGGSAAPLDADFEVEA